MHVSHRHIQKLGPHRPEGLPHWRKDRSLVLESGVGLFVELADLTTDSLRHHLHAFDEVFAIRLSRRCQRHYYHRNPFVWYHILGQLPGKFGLEGGDYRRGLAC